MIECRQGDKIRFFIYSEHGRGESQGFVTELKSTHRLMVQYDSRRFPETKNWEPKLVYLRDVIEVLKKENADNG